MNKVFLTLLLTLLFVPAFSSYADIGHAYHDYYGHYRKYQDQQLVCNSAIADVNAAISQLFFDVKIQNNQWIIYADLDALDESSYYLIRTCPLQTLELANLQQEANQTPSQACIQIMSIIGSILAHDGTYDFRAGYGREVELSVAALDAGKELGNECNIVLRQAQQGGIQQGEPSNGEVESYENEEVSLNEESDESDEAEMNFDIRILASNADNESDESDDSDDDDKEDSDDNSDDENEDQNDSSDDDSDESSDEDSDTEDNDSSGSISWSGSQGLRVKFSKTKDGHEDDYTLSYDPKNGGISIKKSESDDEDDEDEDASEAGEEEESAEEANNEEGDNNEQSQDLSSLISGLYINNGQGGNYNGDRNDIITFLYYL